MVDRGGELGVSRRTVYRDVEVLAKAGVRLESAHGRAGDYRIPRRGRPEMLGLGAEATESAALARALGSDDRRFAALAPPAVGAAARAVRKGRPSTVVAYGAARISFLLTNSSAPKLPSSRPKPERLKPPKGSSGASAPTRLT